MAVRPVARPHNDLITLQTADDRPGRHAGPGVGRQRVVPNSNGTRQSPAKSSAAPAAAAGEDPCAAKPDDSEEMAQHRRRMGTDQAKARYKRRSAIAEYPNADCRNRGLHQFSVRGLVKAKAQSLWHALAFNLLRMKSLCCPVSQRSYLEVVMGV